MSPLAIRCHQLEKTYYPRKGPPVHAVRGLDLEVRTGECFGLLGPNGAGKTTTVEIIEGILPPTAGDIEVLGMTWKSHERELRQRIGISLQETRLPEKMTSLEAVTLFRSFYRNGVDPVEVLQLVRLGDKANSYLGDLSGGQRQRIALACAMAGKPDLLSLDEPTTGLDPQARRDVWDIIRAQKDRGCTTLITTHYMDEAERLCDRVAVVDKGQVIALGSPKELISSLGGEHVIDFSVITDPNVTPISIDVLEDMYGMGRVRHEGDSFLLAVEEPHLAVPSLLRRLENMGLSLARLTTRHASLEDVFVTLTGRHLSDE